MTAASDEQKVSENDVRFAAADGFELAGTLVLADRPRAAVLISAATGFPREFYLPFARLGALRGASCLVYDYRGVGASAPADLGSFPMDYPDWGRLDMAAALERLIAAAPGVPVVHIANSAGGHLAGFMPNGDKIARHIFIGVGLGTWWTHRFPAQQLLDLFFWWIYGPAQLMMKGYIPAGGLWGGSTLPAGAFYTWRRWCHKGDYFRSELAESLKPHRFDEMTAPIISYVFSDDPLTTAESAQTFLQFMPRAEKEIRLRRPADLGVKALGHQNLYRRKNEAAWTEIWAAAINGR
ncbi:MAG: alpha/beta hydrolase [Deltaproteobacteria bacterium]|nr:alpha/beta hydrolase [Deltaproteobacteria bacterium]